MSSTGKVQGLTNFTDVVKEFNIRVNFNHNGQIVGSLSVEGKKGLKQIYKTPPNWRTLLKTIGTQKRNSKIRISDDVSTAVLLSAADGQHEITEAEEQVIDNYVDREGDDNPAGVNGTEIDLENETCFRTNKNQDSNTEHMKSFEKHDIDMMWLSFRECDKRKDCPRDTFLNHISNAEELSKLTKNEILNMLKPISSKLKQSQIKLTSNMRKSALVNKISELFGDGSVLFTKRKETFQPKTLQSITRIFLQSQLPKEFLNAAYARSRYPEALKNWNMLSPFSKNCKVEKTENPDFWYAQPKLLSDNRFIPDFLDPEHLLTNMRTKVCSTGIPKAGISSKAWLEVSKNWKDNGSNLNPVLVENLLDKQNVAYALKTFSLEVENVMKTSGYYAEAEFCSLMRNWYRSQDEPGLSCQQRHVYEQELRRWLLQDVDFGNFPPPGRFVKDIPIVLYEGLLIHIDRRAQLYAFTNGSYNPRSIGTLDVENLFGAFQDWDSKGTGVLRADEVPQALFTACDLYNTRLDEERGFYMHTSAARVYPVPKMTKGVERDFLRDSNIIIHSQKSIRQLQHISMRNHIFDTSERKSANPKRKKDSIGSLDEPAKGIKGVRAERYKVDESKILPHVRAGIALDDVL